MDASALPSLLRQMATLLEQQTKTAETPKKKNTHRLSTADRKHIRQLVKKTLYGTDY